MFCGKRKLRIIVPSLRKITEHDQRQQMTPFLRKLLGQNWLLLLIMLALAVFGVVAIYSATSTRSDPYAADFWRKQANWVAVGVFAFMVTSLVHYRWIRWGALPMYLAGIMFLILTKFMGIKVYGARSWLHLGPINFQPAQLAVVAGIMVLALFLTQFRQMHPALRLLLSGAIAGAPCLLILMQPDLGEVIIWVPVMFALWFVRRPALAVLDLHHSHRNRVHPDCH
jgi:rod shape determining protein RodA